VTCLDNLDPYYPSEVKWANISEALQDRNFRFVRGDILDAGLVDAALSGRAAVVTPDALHGKGTREVGPIQEPVDDVVHLAALAGVRPSSERPSQYMRVNVEGTANLLESACRAGITHFVFASSSSVYGLSKDIPFSEDQELHPASVYGASKRAAEILCQAFYSLYGLPVTALRFFTVYGPRQRPEMAIHKFARLMLRGESIPVYGDGSAARDYTYVDDIVDGLVRAIGRPGEYQVFNLGNTHPTRLDELIEQLGTALGVTPELEHHPDQPGDVPITWAAVSEAERVLGYRPRVDLAEGLERFVKWLRAQPQTQVRRLS